MISVRELVDNYNINQGGMFFSKATLDFFGERINEMKIADKIFKIEDYRGKVHNCYQLKHIQHKAPAGVNPIVYDYFDTETFEIVNQ